MRANNLAAVREHLPPIICDIADLIGYPATEELVRAIGGTTFAFGRGIKDTPRLNILIRAIGEPKTYRLLSVFGGTEEYIPRCEKALKLLRNARFLAEFRALQEQGESATMAMIALAPKYGFSDRMGWHIVRSKTDPLTRQRDLF